MQKLRNFMSRKNRSNQKNDRRAESRLGYNSTTPPPVLNDPWLTQRINTKPARQFRSPTSTRPRRQAKSHGAKRVYRKKVAAGRRTRCRNEQRAKARR
jgi:hypothetical protein